MKNNTNSLYPTTLRLARIHFIYGLVFAVSIIVYDASKLIAPEAVLNRWKYTLGLLIASTFVWYFARFKKNNTNLQKILIALLVVVDIIFTSFLVYADRGMASLGVMLYAIPIVTAASLLSRSAVLATAALSASAYAFVTIKYFVDFFNEGYKVQLYSTVAFYVATFFILALLITVVIRRKTDT